MIPNCLNGELLGRDVTGLLKLAQDIKRLSVAGGLIAALTCCTSLRPDVPEPNVAIPADWAESDQGSLSTDLTEYWRLLDDPLIDRYVEQAVFANRDLAQAAARVDQARAQRDFARGAFFPTISSSAGATRDVGDFAREGVQFSLGGNASWETDLFGRISGNLAAAQADLLAAGFSLNDIQRLVAGQVALATIDARSRQQQLVIARDTLAYQDENLQIARWRVQAGLTSSLDVEQARTQRAQTAATIPSLEAALAATANSVSTLIGEPPGAVLAEFERTARQPVPGPVMLTGFAPPTDVLRRRPDVRAAEASLIASVERVGVARAQWLPLVRLTGNIGAGSATLGNLFDTVTGGLFAGLDQLIFDGGRTQAQIENARAVVRGALAAWEQNILFALEEVESAAVARRAAQERVVITEEAVDAANNSAILARSQYQAGLTDFRTLLVAENQLLSARNQLVGAEADRATSFVRLSQALGGGWDTKAIGIDSLTDGNDE